MMSDEMTVNMIAFPGVTFTPEQMAAVSQIATRLFDAEAQVAQLRAQVAERGMELVIKEMRIDSLTAALEDMRNRWHDAERDWMQLRAQLAERDTVISRWYATADAIMLCATGEIATLSDSGVCGVINDLRAQVATLTERLDRCTCTDDDGNEAP